jgi:type I restriction enzyme M protein
MVYSTLFNLDTRDLKSEAQVETRLLAPLFGDLGYPANAIIPKKQLQPLVVHSGTKKASVEADFLLLGSTGAAKVVVEAKDPTKTIQDAWGQAASYALSYNRDKDEADRIKWLLLSNGHITSLYKHDRDSPLITLQLSDFASGSPPYAALRSYLKYVTTDEVPAGGLSFEITPPDKLNALFNQCHDLIWKKEKLAPADAFFEFCKFIFIKIREDKKREQLSATLRPYQLPMTLAWLDAQKATSKHPVRDILFADLRKDLEDAINKGKKRIFEPNESFRLSADTSRELIKRFQHINLSSIDEDLNGRMFEVFLNAAVRGRALGQYFTPRPLVDFMTRIALHNAKDVTNPPTVIDACCGTAGFLIEVMAYLLAAIRNDTRFNAKEKRRMETHIKNNCLYGIEANERVSHIARINMYLHGDGGSHIFHGEGLDNAPAITEDMSEERKTEVQDHIEKIKPSEFDLVLTNPPFSMSYTAENDDEEKILRQLSLADNATSIKSNVLFLQRYYNLLRDGGEMLIVLDDTVLNGATHEKLRRWLMSKCVMLGIHSMPFNAFFKAKANIKTSVLHVRKKVADDEEQGHVFMSISNNIGHDNTLKDTPERNNLNDILNAYFEWKRTGILEPFIKENQDPEENLECPQQVWLVEPERLTLERLDAFFYAPELTKVWSDVKRMQGKKRVDVKTGVDFKLRSKLTRKQKQELKASGEKLKYIEISDVTRYGLITSFIEGTIDELPTRGEYKVEQGDILMAINNSSRGTVVMVPEEFDGAICTSGFIVIKPDTQDDGHLLWYSLRSEYCRKQIYYLAQTASQPELKLSAWNKYFRIPLPVEAARDKAIQESADFQSYLKAIIHADKFRFV